MSNRDKKRQDLLISLLKPLISEWGFTDVMRNLDFLRESPDFREFKDKSESKVNSLPAAPKTSRKTSILDLISAERLSMEKQDLILILVNNFNKKIFLPRMSDIRDFFEMHGKYFQTYKQRSDALKSVIEILINESVANLEKISKEIHFSGPMELGPLSDAINAAGAAHRLNQPVHREPSMSHEDVPQCNGQEEKELSDKSENSRLKMDLLEPSNLISNSGIEENSNLVNDIEKNSGIKYDSHKGVSNVDHEEVETLKNETATKSSKKIVSEKGEADALFKKPEHK